MKKQGKLEAADQRRRGVLRAFLALFAAPFLPRFLPHARAAAQTPGHHLPNGEFRNNYAGQINKAFSDLMRWRRESPGHPRRAFPLAKNDPQFLRENRTADTLTWIGHATLLLQTGGVNILTDPHFSERASPFSFAGPKRGTPPGIAANDLPEIDAVLISHNHYDHLDSASIKMLARQNPQTRFFCPLKLGGFLREHGARFVHELDWGEAAEWAGIRFTAAPCQHWSSRFPWDRNKTLWAAWIAERAGFRFLFIGDTGYSQDFAALGAQYGGFDWAAIPIGAYSPRWFMKEAHINAEEAAQIFLDLRAQNAAATHWGTFQLTDEPADEPPQKLRAAAAAKNISGFHVFMHGETRMLKNNGGG
ncbi:MAG: MBL fold metallo-hydrolase [Gammaproteobacteria bacterium]